MNHRRSRGEYPQTAESEQIHKIEEYKDKLFIALSEQRIIDVNYSQFSNSQMPIGDFISSANIFMQLLRLYAKKRGIDTVQFGYYHSQADYVKPSDFFSVSPLYYLFYDVYGSGDSPNRIQKELSFFAKGLHVELPSYLAKLEKIPGSYWFDDFNRDAVEQRKESYRQRYGEKVAVIAQTGSTLIKRWSNSQVIELASLLQSKGYQCVILTDAHLKEDQTERTNDLQKYSDQQDNTELVFVKDISDWIIFAGLASVFVTTDSGPAWITGAEMDLSSIDRSQKSTNKLLVHHILTNRYWQVPGAEIFRHPQMSNQMYQYGYLASNPAKRIPDIYREIWGKMPKQDFGPHREDFSGYLEFVNTKVNESELGE